MDTEISPSAIRLPVRPQTYDDDYGSADPTRFDIDLLSDFDEWDKIDIKDLEDNDLWHQTCLQRITARENESNLLDVQNSFLDDKAALNLDPSKEGNVDTFELISISMGLETEEDEDELPDEECDLLRVSPSVLRHLASTYHLPTAFIMAFDRVSNSCGTTFRRQSQNEWDYWCLIPCRTATGRSTATGMFEAPRPEVQMDPINHIHFEGPDLTIDSHSTVLYMKRNCDTRRLQVFVVTREFGGKVQQPLAQVQNALERRSSKDLDDSPCFVLLVYIAFTLRWWGNLFVFFNLELIDHERKLQREIAEETEGFTDTTKVLNVALHTMAAHLHRYKNELLRVDLILSDLRKHRKEMTYKPKPKPRKREEDEKQQDNKEEEEELSIIDREEQKIEQLASQLRAVSSFADEMEKKVQNILALLFNQIQTINDKTLQGILKASQQETRISQRLSLASHMLSRSMKRDSIAMKTIAIMTLAFLPGATFAAIFAMPFFTENNYLSSPSQVWIWVILTAICTAFAFGGYIHVVKRGESTLGDPEDDNDTTVSSEGTTASNAPSAVGNGGNISSNGNKQHRWQRVSQRASQGGIKLRARGGS